VSSLMRRPGDWRKLARPQITQHLGDGDPAPEGCNFDASAEIGRDVDPEPRREMTSLRAVLLCGHVGRSDPRFHIAWP